MAYILTPLAACAQWNQLRKAVHADSPEFSVASSSYRGAAVHHGERKPETHCSSSRHCRRIQDQARRRRAGSHSPGSRALVPLISMRMIATHRRDRKPGASGPGLKAIEWTSPACDWRSLGLARKVLAAPHSNSAGNFHRPWVWIARTPIRQSSQRCNLQRRPLPSPGAPTEDQLPLDTPHGLSS